MDKGICPGGRFPFFPAGSAILFFALLLEKNTFLISSLYIFVSNMHKISAEKVEKSWINQVGGY